VVGTVLVDSGDGPIRLVVGIAVYIVAVQRNREGWVSNGEDGRLEPEKTIFPAHGNIEK
jgi:hypothetical protein